ncbi:hypothetical protein OSTOST_25761 [Ostertagia ostertagi]
MPECVRRFFIEILPKYLLMKRPLDHTIIRRKNRERRSAHLRAITSSPAECPNTISVSFRRLRFELRLQRDLPRTPHTHHSNGIISIRFSRITLACVVPH